MTLSSRMYFAATPLVSAALGLLTVPLMTWTLPEEVIAQFGLFQYASTVLLTIVTLGMDQAFLRELRPCRVQGALLRRCLMPTLGLFAIICVGIGILQLIFGGKTQFTDIQNGLLPLLFINVLLLIVQRFSGQKARISEQGAAYMLAEIGLRLPLVAVLVGSLTVAISIPSHWPLWVLVVGTALSAVTLAGRNKGLWHDAILQAADNTVPALGKLLAFGFPLALAGTMYWALSNFGVYATQLLHGTADTARLVVATSLSNVSMIGQTMFSLLWLPILYRKLDAGITPQYVSGAARRVTAGTTLGFAIVVITLQVVQHLLGAKFRDVAPLATSICTLPALYTISEVTFVGLLVNRNSIYALAATAVALLASVMTNLALTPTLGSTGAAIAVAISAFVFFAARTELAGHAWHPIDRRRVYFGATSIVAVGVLSAALPPRWGLVALLVLLPYLWYDRAIVGTLIRDILMQARHLKRSAS